MFDAALRSPDKSNQEVANENLTEKAEVQSQWPIRLQFNVEGLEKGPMKDYSLFFFCCYCCCHGTAEIQILKTYLCSNEAIS